MTVTCVTESSLTIQTLVGRQKCNNRSELTLLLQKTLVEPVETSVFGRSLLVSLRQAQHKRQTSPYGDAERTGELRKSFKATNAAGKRKLLSI